MESSIDDASPTYCFSETIFNKVPPSSLSRQRERLVVFDNHVSFPSVVDWTIDTSVNADFSTRLEHALELE